MLKCPHCEFKCDNAEIYALHVENCLEHQKINGLVKEEQPPVDYSTMTIEQLRDLCKGNNLEGYTTLNKDDLVKFVQENIK